MRNTQIPGTNSIGKNYLISALPLETRLRVVPHLELVQLHAGDVIYEFGRKLSHAYFPTSAAISLLHVLEDGGTTEFASVGNDGMLGVALLLGGDTMPNQAVVQSQGFAYRLPVEILKYEFSHSEQMKKLLLCYVQFLFIQIAQMSVCNRRHAIQQQLSRWLLVNLDRSPTNELRATHETIANLLGVRREGVSEAAYKLRNQELITYRRGIISILDRAGLEETACECYSLVKQAYRQLSSPPRPAPSIDPVFAVTIAAGRAKSADSSDSRIAVTT